MISKAINATLVWNWNQFVWCITKVGTSLWRANTKKNGYKNEASKRYEKEGMNRRWNWTTPAALQRGTPQLCVNRSKTALWYTIILASLEGDVEWISYTTVT